MKKSSQDVTIRIAASRIEREAAFRIRYEVYVEEMGWQTEYANHETRQLEQPLDERGDVWIAIAGDTIVGTLRVNVGTGQELGPYADAYGIRAVPRVTELFGIVTNFVMRPAYRNLSIAMQLVRSVFSMAVQAGVTTAMIDCEPRMVRLYSWMGFEIHNQDFVHPYYGPGICMKMDTSKWTDRFLQPQLTAA
jgi:N-acyl-L-homoserine lactone synthetase